MNKKTGFKNIFIAINDRLNEIYDKKGWGKKLAFLHKMGILYIIIHALFFYFPSAVEDFNSLDQGVKYIIAFENMVFTVLSMYYFVFFYKISYGKKKRKAV